MNSISSQNNYNYENKAEEVMELTATSQDSQKHPLLKLESNMPFGKYKGNTMRWIAVHYPGYIIWLADKKVKMSAQVFKLAREFLGEQKKKYRKEQSYKSMGGFGHDPHGQS